MRMTPNKVKAESVPSKPANSKPPDIATASVPDTLAVLHVNPDTGLTQAEVDIRLKEHGYNEVAEKKIPPDSHVSRQVLGAVGMDARADHGAFCSAREIL